MKKLTETQKAWQLRHAWLSHRRRLRSKQTKREQRARELIGYALPKIRSTRTKRDLVLAAPAHFSLAQNYDEVVSFLVQVRKAAAIRRWRLTVDFTTIQRLSPAASLVMAAEVDRWRRVKGVRLRPVNLDQWSDEVRRLLQELGFFELLDVDDPSLVAHGCAGSLQFIRFRSGTVTDGKLAKEFREALEEVAGPIVTRQYLYKGLTEAMNNAIQHAYPDAVEYVVPILRRRWWMCGSFDRDLNQLTILFYDQDVGIPARLPRTTHWETIRHHFRRIGLTGPDDAKLIEAAVELGRSSTALEGGGYGLDEIRRFVDSSVDGRLRIVSGRGEYIYKKGGEVRLRTRPYPVGGTLIEWEVRRAVTDAERGGTHEDRRRAGLLGRSGRPVPE